MNRHDFCTVTADASLAREGSRNYPVTAELQGEKDGEPIAIGQDRHQPAWVKFHHGVLEHELAVALDWCPHVEQACDVEEVLRLRNQADVSVDRSVVATPVLLPGVVLSDSHRAIRIVLDKDAVCVRWALVLLVDVGVATFLSLVGRHESDLTFFITREVCLILGQVELVVRSELLRRSVDIANVLCEGAVETEIEVAHEEVDVLDRIRLDLVLFSKQADLLEDFLSHDEAMGHFVLPRLEVTVDEAERGVVEGELDHDATLPAVFEHVLHDEVLAGVSHEDTVEGLDEDTDLAITTI